MGKTSKISLMLIVVIFAVIVGGTALKVMDHHNEKLLRVATNKIEEAASKCYLDGKCTGDRTSLGAIIKEGYISQQVHPISKEFISENLIITCKDFFCETELD